MCDDDRVKIVLHGLMRLHGRRLRMRLPVLQMRLHRRAVAGVGPLRTTNTLQGSRRQPHLTLITQHNLHVQKPHRLLIIIDGEKKPSLQVPQPRIFGILARAWGGVKKCTFRLFLLELFVKGPLLRELSHHGLREKKLSYSRRATLHPPRLTIYVNYRRMRP